MLTWRHCHEMRCQSTETIEPVFRKSLVYIFWEGGSESAAQISARLL